MKIVRTNALLFIFSVFWCYLSFRLIYMNVLNLTICLTCVCMERSTERYPITLLRTALYVDYIFTHMAINELI